MNSYLAIALGGAAGAVSRYWLSTIAERLNGSGFPVGTFLVNLLGSFAIGLVFMFFLERQALVDSWRPLLVIGFLGAFTTFSTFSLDALLLFQQGHYNTALFYIVSSVLLCLLAVFAGMQAGRMLF